MKHLALIAFTFALFPLSSFAADCPPVIQNPDGSYSLTFPDGSSASLDPSTQKLSLQMSGENAEQESATLDGIGSDGRINDIAGLRYTHDALNQVLLTKDKIDIFLADDGTLGGSYTPQDSSNSGFAFQIKVLHPDQVICLEDEAAPYLVNAVPDRLIITSDSLVVDAFSDLQGVKAELNQCELDKSSAAATSSEATAALQAQLINLQASVDALTSRLASSASRARTLRRTFRGLTDQVRRHSSGIFSLVRSRERAIDSGLKNLGKN